MHENDDFNMSNTKRQKQLNTSKRFSLPPSDRIFLKALMHFDDYIYS